MMRGYSRERMVKWERAAVSISVCGASSSSLESPRLKSYSASSSRFRSLMWVMICVSRSSRVTVTRSSKCTLCVRVLWERVAGMSDFMMLSVLIGPCTEGRRAGEGDSSLTLSDGACKSSSSSIESSSAIASSSACVRSTSVPCSSGFFAGFCCVLSLILHHSKGMFSEILIDINN